MAAEFDYEIPGEDTGECWAISAHKNGDGVIKGGTYDGWNLSTLYEKHRELFGNSTEPVFPLLVKIIDAKADLSIQVHPDVACQRTEWRQHGSTHSFWTMPRRFLPQAE